MAKTTETRVKNVLPKQHANKPFSWFYPRGANMLPRDGTLSFQPFSASSFFYGIFSEQQGLVTMAFCYHNGAFIALVFGGCKHTLKHMLERQSSF